MADENRWRDEERWRRGDDDRRGFGDPRGERGRSGGDWGEPSGGRDWGRGFGGERGYGERGYGQGQSGQSQPGYGRSGYDQPGYGQPGYGRESWGGAGGGGRGGYGEDWRGGRDDRGMLDRAADEVSSWFGDDEARRRREMDERRQGEHRGRGPKGYARSDDRIREDVCDRLADDPSVDASEIEVAVSGAEVTLTGTVSNRDQRRRAEDCVERISGVTHVQNNLRVKPSGGAGASSSGSAGAGALGGAMDAGSTGTITTSGSPDVGGAPRGAEGVLTGRNDR